MEVKSKKMPQAEQKKEKKKEEGMEQRQEPEGMQADTTITEHDRREVCMLLSLIITESLRPEELFFLI